MSMPSSMTAMRMPSPVAARPPLRPLQIAGAPTTAGTWSVWAW